MTPIAQSPLQAALLITIASAVVAVTTLFAKALGTDALGPPLHPLQIAHGRFLFAFIAIAGTVLALRYRLQRPHWRLHWLRASLGFAGVTLMFAAVAFIPLSDATAISFLNPVFAMLLAIPLLGEKIGRWRWLATALALSGALILTRPGGGTLQPAALLALGAAAIIGLELIIIRKLATRERPLQVLFFNNAIGLGLASLAVLPVFAAPTLAQWGALIGLGFTMALAQALFVNALARADASFVGPFSYSAILFAALYDLVIFDVVPDSISILGAAIIIAGAVLLAWREGLARRRQAA